MARAGVRMTKILLFRGAKAKSLGHGMSKLAGVDQGAKPRSSDEKGTADKGGDQPPYWVPHPRTGIYFPKGHEWVMEEVPNGAASFGQTYWLRNTDGVDKPDLYQISNDQSMTGKY
ncbi:unnamed protein product [Ilex paraguariensis]|uniref:Uncharacterized protein n=1 Tax=Ilex paraguariensis TaxID=185542 RepID=A0ABC8UJG9_9AQUA